MKILLAVLLLFASGGQAAESTEENPFREYAERGELTPYMQIANFSFYIGAPDIHGKAYVPNFSTLIGVSMGWDDYKIASAFALPIPKEEIDRRGKSDQFNFLFSRYWRRSAVDVYFQRYRGFYAGNPVSEFNLSKPERFTQFPEASSLNYGFNYYYVWNEENYSLKAAFANKEEQLRSGGSPLVHAFYNHVELSLGNVIIPGTESDAIQVMPELQDVSLETLGAGAGYGYTHVAEQYVATAQLVAALGGQRREDQYTLALKGNLNLSCAYRLERGFLGLRFLMDSLFSQTRGEQLYSTLMLGTLFFSTAFLKIGCHFFVAMLR